MLLIFGFRAYTYVIHGLCFCGGPDVVKSRIACMLFSVVLFGWALTFAFDGEQIFGSYWKHLAIYNIEDKYGPGSVSCCLRHTLLCVLVSFLLS